MPAPSNMEPPPPQNPPPDFPPVNTAAGIAAFPSVIPFRQPVRARPCPAPGAPPSPLTSPLPMGLGAGLALLSSVVTVFFEPQKCLEKTVALSSPPPYVHF